MNNYNFTLSAEDYFDGLGYVAEVCEKVHILDDETDDTITLGEFKGYRMVPYDRESGEPIDIVYDLDLFSETAVFMNLFEHGDSDKIWADKVLSRLPDLDCFSTGIFFLDKVEIYAEYRGQSHFEGMLDAFTKLMNLQVVLLKSYPLQWCKVSCFTGRQKGVLEEDLRALKSHYEKSGFICLEDEGPKAGKIMIKTFY